MKCKACGAEDNGYSHTVKETIINRDGNRVKLIKKYWKCLACGADTFVNAFEER